jgi:hypothetical protein
VIRKHAAALALGASIIAISACGDVSPTDPYTLHAGPYILHSISGQELPVELASTEEGTFTVTTGALTLRRDRSFTETWTGRLDPPEGPPEFGAISASGTYEIRGEDITFNLPAAPGRDETTVIGLIRGDTLTYVLGGLVIVYLD